MGTPLVTHYAGRNRSLNADIRRNSVNIILEQVELDVIVLKDRFFRTGFKNHLLSR